MKFIYTDTNLCLEVNISHESEMKTISHFRIRLTHQKEDSQDSITINQCTFTSGSTESSFVS